SDQANACPACAYPIPRRYRFQAVIQTNWDAYFSNIVKSPGYVAAKFFMDRVITECKLDIHPSIQHEAAIWNEFFTALRDQTEAIKTPEEMADFFERMENAVRRGNETRPRCPQCGSYMVAKISGTQKFLGASFFGLGSRSVGKNMECRDCGYMW
ncbi:MAG: hypothetical protein IKK21_12605, partial [Clostridia bacterium]|nr:hypothetical protein [Clostridia bacterium]